MWFWRICILTTKLPAYRRKKNPSCDICFNFSDTTLPALHDGLSWKVRENVREGCSSGSLSFRQMTVVIKQSRSSYASVGFEASYFAD
jgi:hypothetical protein